MLFRSVVFAVPHRVTSSFVIFHDYSIFQPTYPSPKGEGFADPLSGTLNSSLRPASISLSLVQALQSQDWKKRLVEGAEDVFGGHAVEGWCGDALRQSMGSLAYLSFTKRANSVCTPLWDFAILPVRSKMKACAAWKAAR